jgi:hypothetical protein
MLSKMDRQKVTSINIRRRYLEDEKGREPECEDLPIAVG